MKLINSGAEAKIYSETLFGTEIVVKERKAKPYRIAQLDSELRETRTKSEARILYEVGAAGINAPRLVGIGKFRIYATKIKGKLLIEAGVGRIDFGKIGMQLALMHNANVAHGDFTPANIMKCGSEYFVIDFGLSEITGSVEEKAIDLLLLKRSIEPAQYREFAKGYARISKNPKIVTARLKEIEKRGRYQVRTLA
ncbi:MAG: Kae1-associated serine/threonine protein kinase [Candidatus Micrarchaeota archaeon]|nr:Kae1-associated serine/threonine protein kinase [Candidatus Micrarchaeota archaeon]